MRSRPSGGIGVLLEPVPGILAAAVLGLGAAFVDEKACLAVLGGLLGLLAWRNRARPHDVVGILLAGFCMAPLFRRVHDFRNGWTESNPILIAPYVLLPVVLVAVLRRLPRFRTFPLALAVIPLLAITYAFCWGVVGNGPQGAVIALLEWGSGPLLFCYVVQYRESFDPDRFRGWILWLALFEAVYGIVQFVQVPPWDAYWLMSSKMYTSMGFPVPFQMRTFGTLNSAGPYAAFLAFYLLLNVGSRSFYLVAPLAIAALGTTMVRAAWVVVAIGWFLSILLAPRGARSRIAGPMIGTALAVACAVVPIGDRIGALTDRVQTFGDLSSDNSYQDRAKLLQVAKKAILATPEGAGLGSEGRAARYNKAGIAGIDNGFVALAWVFGWAAACAYLAGWLVCFAGPFRRLGRMPVSIHAMGITSLALFCFNAFGTAFSGLIAMILWVSLGVFAGWRPDENGPEASPPQERPRGRIEA